MADRQSAHQVVAAATPMFTGEFRADTNVTYSFNRPDDHTIGGSSEIFRSGEFQVTQLGVGGDVHVDGVTAADDAVRDVLADHAAQRRQRGARPVAARRRLSAWCPRRTAATRFNRLNGINVQAGIFMSYIGLWSYYNFDNWTYQPSYVSSNTPWFFNGVRVQILPDRQAQDRAVADQRLAVVRNVQPSAGCRRSDQLAAERIDLDHAEQLLGRRHARQAGPSPYPHRRQHPGEVLRSAGEPAIEGGLLADRRRRLRIRRRRQLRWRQRRAYRRRRFVGFMAYHRAWFARDRYALTLGGGAIDNPGRYLVLMPPINGATALSGTPYFSADAGDQFSAWDVAGRRSTRCRASLRPSDCEYTLPLEQRAVFQRAGRA